jgi:iron complex transport system substrate-binding protein
MRRLVLLLLLALAAPTLVACGNEASDDTQGEQRVATPPQAVGDEVIEGVGTFPTTVEHQFGSTTIESAPLRVVSVGLTEQDVLLQLGVIPIAVTESYGDQPDATWPWAHELLGGARPEVLSNSDRIELEKRDYELLSKIAPTVTSVVGATPYFSPWQDQVLQVARALGREAHDVVWATEDADMYAELQDFATVKDLPAVAERRTVYTGATLAGAIYFITPLSLEHVLAELIPRLEKGVAGQGPSTYES